MNGYLPLPKQTYQNGPTLFGNWAQPVVDQAWTLQAKSETARALQAESDDDDWAHHPDIHGAYNPQVEVHKLRVQELKKAAKPANKKRKTAAKPNVTEDEAARNGLARLEERAENNRRTKWVWDRIMRSQ